MLTGAEEDPRKIAMSRMLDSLLTHTETMTATETMEQEYKDRYDLKRLLREHDYAAGLIAGPHLLAMLGKTHDARTVDKIKRSPSFEWLRGVWSRAYMTDPKRATAIIRQSLEKKPRRLTAEKAEHAAIHAARGMMPAAGTETGGTFTLDMDAPSDMIETVRHMMDETGIPYHEEPSLDPGRSRFSMDERYTPAVKAMLDAHIQARDDIDQSMFPEWEALRKTARGIINDDPDLKKKNRPVEPDWAATIAGRLNANLLDRVNGSVHDDWVGGILPPIRSRKHDAALDLVRQNERLIETRIDSLEQEARRTKQAWVGQVLAAAGDSDKRLLRDVVVYRAMWSVEDADNPLGERPPAESGRQEQHWANLNGRINHTSGVVKPPKPTREEDPHPRSRPRLRSRKKHRYGRSRSSMWRESFWTPAFQWTPNPRPTGTDCSADAPGTSVSSAVCPTSRTRRPSTSSMADTIPTSPSAGYATRSAASPRHAARRLARITATISTRPHNRPLTR